MAPKKDDGSEEWQPPAALEQLILQFMKMECVVNPALVPLNSAFGGADTDLGPEIIAEYVFPIQKNED